MDIDQIFQIVSKNLKGKTLRLPGKALGANSSPVGALFAANLSDGVLVLKSARAKRTGDRVEISGTGDASPFTGLKVSAQLAISPAGAVQFNATARSSKSWVLSRNFPALAGTLADSIEAVGATLTLSSVADKQTAQGLNFSGKLLIGGSLETLAWGAIIEQLEFSGPIGSAKGLPTFNLTASSKPITLGPLKKVVFQLALVVEPVKYTSRPAKGKSKVSYYPAVFFEFRTAIPFQAKGRRQSVPIVAEFRGPTGLIVFEADLSDVTGLLLSDLKQWASSGTLSKAFPPGLDAKKPFVTDSVELVVGYQSPYLQMVAVSLQTNRPWKVLQTISKKLPVIDKLQMQFAVQNPGQSAAISIGFQGEMSLGRAKFDIGANYPDLSVYGGLARSSKIPLSSFLKEVFPAAQGLPRLSINELGFSATPSLSSYMFEAGLTGSFQKSLGFAQVKLDELSLVVDYADGTTTGVLSGSATIGKGAGAIALQASWNIPGDFSLQGSVASLSLASLVKTLTGTAPDFPKSFDLTFTNSFVLIQKTGADYTFQLQTTASDGKTALGSAAFEVARLAGEWGFALGVSLDVDDLREVPGLGFFQIFDGSLELTDLTLVVSTLSGQQLNFPALTTSIPQVTLPAGTANPPDQSGSYFAVAGAVTLNASKKDAIGRATLVVSKFLHITDFHFAGVLTVSVPDPAASSQLILTASGTGGAKTKTKSKRRKSAKSAKSANTAATKRMTVDPGTVGDGATPLQYDYQKHNISFSGSLFVAISAGVPSVGLTGTAVINVEKQPLEFSFELKADENGATAAGVMKGTWPNPFGLQGLTVSDAFLEIGIDDEGIPTIGFGAELTDNGLVPALKGIDLSFAVLFDSTNPRQSMFAGAVSDINLGQIAALFFHKEKLPSNLQSLFSKIAIKGIGLFTTGSLAKALKNDDLAAVTRAFVNAGVPNPPQPAGALLVKGTNDTYFLTDRTTFTHYEITTSGKKTTIALEAQVVVKPAGVSIGPPSSPLVPAGQTDVHLDGELELFGFRLRVLVQYISGRGLAADATLAPIDALGGNLKVTGQDVRKAGAAMEGRKRRLTADSSSKKGPNFSLATFAQPNRKAPYNLPHLIIDGKATILDISAGVLIAVTDEGLVFQFVFTSPKVIKKIEFDFSLTGLDDISGGATLIAAVNATIDAGPFGKIPLVNFDVNADLSFAYDGKTFSIHVDVQDFSLGALGLEIGPYSFDFTLSGTKATFAAIPGEIVKQIENLSGQIEDDLKDATSRWIGALKNGLIKGVKQTADDIARALDEAGHSFDYIAKGLLEFGSDADEIAAALNNIEDDAGAIAGALHFVDFGPHHISAALKFIGHSYEVIVKELKGLEYDAGDIADSLERLGAEAGDIASALFENDFDANDIAGALRSIGHSIGVVAVELDKLDFSSGDIAEALKKADFDAKDAAHALKEAGFKADDIVHALKDGAGYAEHDIKDAAKDLGHDISGVVHKIF